MMESPLFLFDAGFRAANGVFCGIDEAGRGPLAGPVCAGCALLPEGLPHAGLNDSKKLTEKRREALFEQLTADETVCWGVGWASPAEIDDVNILQATFLAMGRAYADMQTRFPTIAPVLALVDGNRTPPLPLPVQTLIGGDGKSASVAAASIIAKVSRDRLMKKLAEQYPQYQLDKHKGYPTKLHYEMIEQYGISEIHRRSFLKGRSQ